MKLQEKLIKYLNNDKSLTDKETTEIKDIIYEIKKQNLDIDFKDQDVQDFHGHTALMLSTRYLSSDKKTKMAKALILAGADINLKDNNSSTALIEALQDASQITEIIELLIAKGANKSDLLVNFYSTEANPIITGLDYYLFSGNIDQKIKVILMYFLMRKQ